MYKANISEFTYSNKCVPLNIPLRVQFRYFHAVAIVQNIFGMSSNSVLGARMLYLGSSRAAYLFVSRTDLVFEVSKRAFRIEFRG